MVSRCLEPATKGAREDAFKNIPRHGSRHRGTMGKLPKGESKMTIEELFTKEYQEQKETIKALNQRIEELQAQYNELVEVATGDAKTRDQYKDTIIDEIKYLELYFNGVRVVSDYWELDIENIKSKLPILTGLGLILFDKIEDDKGGK